MESSKTCLLSLFVLLSLAALVHAHIGHYDDHWLKRSEEAKKDALEAYHSDPEEVTEHLNTHVRIALEESNNNSTRRSLMKQYRGKCLATNPIDRCWRCRADWATDRKRLASCVLGFGRKTVGGKYGRIYTVTSPKDDNIANPRPGTLRHAVIQKQPLWIIFARSMVITLSQELMVNSHKTIDGRGVNVHIAYGAGITIQFVKNVIVHNLHVHDIVVKNGGMIRDSVDHIGFRTPSDGDGISLFGATNVWVDHISMANCKDGLVDIIQGSTAVTLSNLHMTHHNEVMLFGASDSYTGDAIMQVTVAFNHFGRGLVQRMPRCRWGFVHVVNNDYTHWLMYAIGGSMHPTIISQGNRFIAPPTQAAKEVTKRDYATEDVWKNWTWRSEGDLLMNGAFFVQSGNPSRSRRFSKKDQITAKSGSFVTRLTRFSGALNCRIGKPC